MSPLDEHGNPCHISESICHFARRGGIGCLEPSENLQGMYKDACKCDIDIGREELFILEKVTKPSWIAVVQQM